MEPASGLRKNGQRRAPPHPPPDASLRDDAHPLGFGDEVSVLALDTSGRPFLEGRATIIRQCAQPHLYHVTFAGERSTRIRFVNPDWQARPDRSVALLIEFFHANRITNPSVDDFFPEEF
jgi:hypothetical protein